jgi:hypothetical protein
VNLVDRLLASKEPSIRLQLRLEGPTDAEVTDLREQVRKSARVATLLSKRNPDGTIDARRTRNGLAHTGCW